MEIGGQLHTPAALPLRNRPQYPSDGNLSESKSGLDATKRRRNISRQLLNRLSYNVSQGSIDPFVT
jgi:hypothetical protein